MLYASSGLPECRSNPAAELRAELGRIALHMGGPVRYAAAVIELYARVSREESDAILVKLALSKAARRERICKRWTLQKREVRLNS